MVHVNTVTSFNMVQFLLMGYKDASYPFIKGIFVKNVGVP